MDPIRQDLNDDDKCDSKHSRTVTLCGSGLLWRRVWSGCGSDLRRISSLVGGSRTIAPFLTPYGRIRGSPQDAILLAGYPEMEHASPWPWGR